MHLEITDTTDEFDIRTFLARRIPFEISVVRCGNSQLPQNDEVHTSFFIIHLILIMILISSYSLPPRISIFKPKSLRVLPSTFILPKGAMVLT